MPDCKKVKFKSREEARARLDEIRANSNSGLRNVYECKACGFWHLTKMTKRNYTEGVKNGGFQLKKMIETGIAVARQKKWLDDSGGI